MSPGSPVKIPGPLYGLELKNMFPPNFITFARTIFHHFETLLRPFSTLSRQIGLILYMKTSIHIENQPKLIITKINYSVLKIWQKTLEKSRLIPKLNARGKPSTWFPPEKLVKLSVGPGIPYKNYVTTSFFLSTFIIFM